MYALIDWTCPSCRVKNKSTSEICVECKCKRPVYKDLTKEKKVDPKIAAQKQAEQYEQDKRVAARVLAEEKAAKLRAEQ